MALSNRNNRVGPERRSTSNFNSMDAIVFSEPETRLVSHPPLLVKSFIDETSVEIVESYASSDNEFHPAICPQEILLFENPKKSFPFRHLFSFRGLLSILNVSALQFFGIIAACILLGACISFFSEKRHDSPDNVQTLLEKASTIEQYLYRDEQRALHRQ
jgi:hypothetical protein